MPLFSSSSNTAVCSFEAWTQEAFRFSAVLRYSNVYSTCSIGKGKLNAQGSVRIRYSIYDQTTTISQCSSINVRIKPVKTSTKHLNYPVLFQVCSHLKVYAPRWKHLLCCECFWLIIHIQLQPFNNCLRPSHLSQHFVPHHQEATPWCDSHPWSPISRACPFPCADAEVEAWRGRKVARRYQGSVRWRSHEGHSSLGG